MRNYIKEVKPGKGYLLDDNTLKGFIYVGLWILFVVVTTITSYIRYQERRKK